MLLLGTTSTVLRMVTGAAASITADCDFVDYASGATTPNTMLTGAVTSAATTTIVAAPAASTVRNVRGVRITNNHASASTQVTVQKFDGTTSTDLFGVTLLAGENVIMGEDGEWRHHDTQGAEYSYTVPAAGNLGIAGALAQNMPRAFAGTSTTAGASGTLYLAAIYLTAGQTVSNITIVSGATAFTSPTNYFFALYSGLQSAPALLAQSANQTTTAWGAGAVKTLAMTTPYRVITSGVYYVGVMVTAATMGTLNGPAALPNTTLASQAPILFASSTAGLTTALPNPAAALSFNGTMARFYCAVS